MSEIEVPEMYKKHQEWLAQTGGPAYPGGVNSVYTHIDPGEPTQQGMALRDYLAGQALTGMLAGHTMVDGKACLEQGDLAVGAYRIADAMLAERGKEAR